MGNKSAGGADGRSIAPCGKHTPNIAAVHAKAAGALRRAAKRKTLFVMYL
jgi:hypothetical protein